jgi:hypothetical protein
MSTVIELTVADNEHEDIAIVWHAHQSYSGLGALGIWARRSRHGMAVRCVPGGNIVFCLRNSAFGSASLLYNIVCVAKAKHFPITAYH